MWLCVCELPSLKAVLLNKGWQDRKMKKLKQSFIRTLKKRWEKWDSLTANKVCVYSEHQLPVDLKKP